MQVRMWQNSIVMYCYGSIRWYRHSGKEYDYDIFLHKYNQFLLATDYEMEGKKN